MVFGCDQNMWRFVWPAFAENYRIVLFDHVGCGGSDLSAYHPQKYEFLEGYADDLIDLCRALDRRSTSPCGLRRPFGKRDDRRHRLAQGARHFRRPRYDRTISPPHRRPEYTGGFSEAQVYELLDFFDANHMGFRLRQPQRG
jgi:sigma-B regulation protein RsbQ